MAMKKCPECGEKYSDTYKRCPFCDEAQKLSKGKRVQKRNMKNGGRRAGTSDKENILTLILLVIMLVLAGILLWLLFGGGSEEDPPAGGTSSQVSSQTPGGSSSGGGSQVIPGGTGSETPGGSSTPQMPEDKTPTADDIKALPETLTLSKSDMTLNAGTTWNLKVGDGTGTYTWVSANPNIATVDSSGKVTAVANGNAYIYATDGTGMGKCIVRVKGGSAPATGGSTGGESGGSGGGSTGTTVDASKATLNKTDVTIEVGAFLALKVKNFDGEVTWSVEDPSIASVLNDGSVKALKKGRTNVIATVGDRTLKCIVRVTTPKK